MVSLMITVLLASGVVYLLGHAVELIRTLRKRMKTK